MWPYGLRAIVLVGYVVFSIAALTVIFSGPIREHSTLIVFGFGSGLGLPAQTVWPLVLLLSFGVAALMAAAQHGPWWLKLLGLLFTLIVMGTWSLRSPSLVGWGGWPIMAAVLMVALLALVILRWRRSFAWWEFAVMWALIGLTTTIGVAETREAKIFGQDFNPLHLQQTAALLGYLALPAATLAGASVAEVSVRATVSATQNAQRLATRSWPYVILAVVVGIRLAQGSWQIVQRDPVVEGLTALLWAGALVAAFVLIGFVVLRLSGRRGFGPAVSELGDELGRMGFAVAASLIAITIPVQVFLAVIQVVGSLQPGGAASRLSYDITPLVTQVVDPGRVLIGVVLLILAVRAARRGQAGRALVMGCIGVMLVALARQLLFRQSLISTDQSGCPQPGRLWGGDRRDRNLVDSTTLDRPAGPGVRWAVDLVRAFFVSRLHLRSAWGGAWFLGGSSGVVRFDLGPLYRLGLGKRGEPPLPAPHPSAAGVDQLRVEHDGARVRRHSSVMAVPRSISIRLLSSAT
jgi:hypothetical protein